MSTYVCGCQAPPQLDAAPLERCPAPECQHHWEDHRDGAGCVGRGPVPPLGPKPPLSYPCPHDDDPRTCPPCSIARRPKPVIAYGPTFRASYDAHCQDCNLPVHQGQRIRAKLVDNVTTTYVHEVC